MIIGGGPHIRICVSGPGGGRCACIISALMNPELNFHSVGGERMDDESTARQGRKGGEELDRGRGGKREDEGGRLQTKVQCTSS